MKPSLFIGTISASALLFAGCSTLPHSIYVEPAPLPAAVEVVYVETIPIAEPPIVVVTRPSRPSRSYVWIEGYWTWDTYYRRYVWQDGYWTLPPYSGAVWVPGYWELYTGRGYVWVTSTWTPRGHVMNYGTAPNRYDYYGRTVYYARPARAGRTHVITYDNRPEYMNRSYTSSPVENNSRGRSNLSPATRPSTSRTPEYVNSRSTEPSNTRNAAAGSSRNADTAAPSRSSTPSGNGVQNTTPSRTAPANDNSRPREATTAPASRSNENTTTAPSRSSSRTTTPSSSSSRSSATQSTGTSRSSGTAPASRSSSSGTNSRSRTGR